MKSIGRNRFFAQNSSFNHIYNQYNLESRPGSTEGRKQKRVHGHLRSHWHQNDSSSCFTSRPGASVPAGLGPLLTHTRHSPFDKLVFSYHSPLPARGKNCRVATWQSPCQWSIQVQSMDWILSSMWVEMISNAFSYIHSSLFGDPDGGTGGYPPGHPCQVSIFILHTYLNYPTYLSQLSSRCIPSILHILSSIPIIRYMPM